jgi:hypothetical protein
MNDGEVGEVVTRFQWDQSEFMRVVRHGLLKRILTRMYAVSALLLICAVFATSLHTPSAAVYLYFLSGFYLVMTVFYRQWLPGRMWKKGLGIQGPLEISVSERGVSTKSSAIETKANWEAYLFSEEWKGYYFLKRTKRFSTLTIPKRGFATKQDEARFRELLLTHTKAKLVEEPRNDTGLVVEGESETLS